MLSFDCVKPEDVAAAIVLVLVLVLVPVLVLTPTPKVAVADAVSAVVFVEGSTVVKWKDVTVGTGDVMLMLQLVGTSVVITPERVGKEFVAVISGGGPCVLMVSVGVTVLSATVGVVVENC